jgi:hypothetical protein
MMYFRSALAVAIVLLCSAIASPAQNIVINEFMSANQNVIQDQFDKYSDWIEIYNDDDHAVSLSGWMLSDREDEPGKFIFPDIEIVAKGFLLIFASGNEASGSKELHADFKIASSGETLILSDDKGIPVDRMNPVSLAIDESFGRFPDGSDYLVNFTKSTPGTSNNAEGSLSFSHDPGFYTKPFDLALNSAENDVVIYYTLNGNVPDVNSLKYSTPITVGYKYDSPNIYTEIPTSPDQDNMTYKAWESPEVIVDKATVVRAQAYRDTLPLGKIVTRTFIVDSAIFTKYHYPIFSLVSDSLNIFSYDSGIYVPGIMFDSTNPQWTGNYRMADDEWERPVHVEMFSNEGSLLLSQDAGIKIHGNFTRQAAQKSLRLYARSEYGDKRFNAQLFPQRKTDEFKRILLRTTMMTMKYRAGYSIIGDAMICNLVRDLDLEVQDYQPSLVFLNAEYWGIHTIRDRIDEYFLAEKYDLDNDEINRMYGENIVDEGNGDDFIALSEFIANNDLANNSNYQHVADQIDISNFIDYNITQIFFSNDDRLNIKFWKSNEPDAKWRWILYDMDNCFGYPPFNMLKHVLDTNVIEWNNPTWSTSLIRSLMKNENFKKQFLDRFAFLLNTTFQTENILNKIAEFKEQYGLEIEGHIDRWHYPKDKDYWLAEIDYWITNFATVRPCLVLGHILEYFDLSSDEFAFKFKPDSVEEFSETACELSPNPSNGNFNIIIPDKALSLTNISVVDIYGKEIYSSPLIGIQAGMSVNIELPSATANGVYFVRLIGTGGVITKKIVVRD